MKTPERDASKNAPLPPPPAPTARDANPWTVSSQAKVPGTRQLGSKPDWLRPKVPKVPPEARRPDRAGRPRSAVPLVVLLFMLGAALAAAAQALAKGDVPGAVGPLVIAGFAAVIMLRRARRRGP